MYCGHRDLERDGVGRAEGAHGVTIGGMEGWEVGWFAWDSPRSGMWAGGWWVVTGKGLLVAGDGARGMLTGGEGREGGDSLGALVE